MKPINYFTKKTCRIEQQRYGLISRIISQTISIFQCHRIISFRDNSSNGRLHRPKTLTKPSTNPFLSSLSSQRYRWHHL
jgi:hypothetical protein